MSAHGVTAIVLAGGRSSRFGSPKLEARIGDETLLARTIAAVSTVADGVIVAGPSLPEGWNAGEIPVALLPDARPFDGPLAALVGILGTFDAQTVTDGSGNEDLAIVVGADMPALVPAVLDRMLDRLRADPSLDAATLRQAEGAPRAVLPLALRIVPAASAAQTAMKAGDRSLVRLLDRVRSVEIPASEWLALDPAGRTLKDVDRPQDLAEMRRELR